MQHERVRPTCKLVLVLAQSALHPAIQAALEEYELPSDEWTIPLNIGVETFIYFVQADEGGPIKIGRADDPATRLKELQTGNPSLLILRRCVIDSPDYEWVLHRLFSDFRIRGEWFQPHPVLAAMGDAIPDESLADQPIVYDPTMPSSGHERFRRVQWMLQAMDIARERGPAPEPEFGANWKFNQEPLTYVPDLGHLTGDLPEAERQARAALQRNRPSA